MNLVFIKQQNKQPLHDVDWWWMEVFDFLMKEARRRGHRVSAEYLKYDEPFLPDLEGWAQFLGPMKQAVLDKDTGMFMILDYRDTVMNNRHVMAMVEHPKCVGMISGQYKTPEKGKHPKCHPWMYFSRFIAYYESVLEKMRRIEKDGDKRLFFKGDVSSRIPHRLAALKPLAEAGVVNSDFAEKVPFDEYYALSASKQFHLSIPGYGALCHRELESMGFGCVVFMPPFENEMWSVPVPLEHYVPINADPYDSTAFVKEIVRVYNWIKDDDKLLKNISRNAMRWFDENVLMENAMPKTMDFVEKSLKGELK